MASEQEIAKAMSTYLLSRGYECGQRYTGLQRVVEEIKYQFSDETEASLRSKAVQIIENPEYRFKTKRGELGTEVSASALMAI